MTFNVTTRLRTFRASVDFRCAGEIFATENFAVEVDDDSDPYPLARARAEASTYANERIPDLDFKITLTPA